MGIKRKLFWSYDEMFALQLSGEGRRSNAVEVPEDLVNRYERVLGEFHEVQGELSRFLATAVPAPEPPPTFWQRFLRVVWGH